MDKRISYKEETDKRRGLLSLLFFYFANIPRDDSGVMNPKKYRRHSVVCSRSGSILFRFIRPLMAEKKDAPGLVFFPLSVRLVLLLYKGVKDVVEK